MKARHKAITSLIFNIIQDIFYMSIEFLYLIQVFMYNLNTILKW
nr:MAG TPA: hypothetical protein [Microviridae sp.]